jgi:hypothetical protein
MASFYPQRASQLGNIKMEFEEEHLIFDLWMILECGWV